MTLSFSLKIFAPKNLGHCTFYHAEIKCARNSHCRIENEIQNLLTKRKILIQVALNAWHMISDP